MVSTATIKAGRYSMLAARASAARGARVGAAFLATTFATTLALHAPGRAQSIDRAAAQPALAPLAQAEIGGGLWLSVDEMRQIARAKALRERASVFVDETDAGRIEAGAGFALAQRAKWHATLGVESYALASPEEIAAVGMSARLPERAGYAGIGTAAASSVVAQSSPMALMTPAHQGFRRYTGLRLTSTDVLLPGDRLTLRAGSDLHYLMQGLGVEDWTGGVAAFAGFASRMELRWARPAAHGELSLTYTVDRKAGEFRHEHLLARWQAHF